MAPTDQLTQAHHRIEHAVQAIVTGDQWRQMLQVAARFHSYSPSNIWLILAQTPDATQVAGFHTSRKVRRQVRKGEHGIAILAPMVSRARPVHDADGAKHSELVRVPRGFRVVHVFDMLPRPTATRYPTWSRPCSPGRTLPAGMTRSPRW